MLASQELRKDGFDLAEARYKELKPILDEVILYRAFYGDAYNIEILSRVVLISISLTIFCSLAFTAVGCIGGGAES